MANGSQPGSWTLSSERFVSTRSISVVTSSPPYSMANMTRWIAPSISVELRPLVALGDVLGDQRMEVEQAGDVVDRDVGWRREVDPEPALLLREGAHELVAAHDVAGAARRPRHPADARPGRGRVAAARSRPGCRTRRRLRRRGCWRRRRLAQGPLPSLPDRAGRREHTPTPVEHERRRDRERRHHRGDQEHADHDPRGLARGPRSSASTTSGSRSGRSRSDSGTYCWYASGVAYTWS